MFLIALLVQKNARRDFIEILHIPKKLHSIIASSQLFGFLGFISLLLALSLGTATLVSSISTVKPLIILVFTVLLSHFFPHILIEDTDTKKMMTKLLAIMLMIIGTIITITC